MCRTGGRRCPSHSDPIHIALRNEQRRKLYAKAKHSAGTSEVGSALTPEQESYFKNSKAIVDGKLVTVYHGAGSEFTSFDPSTLGKGNDSWGNGFYFTDQETTAKGYAADYKSEDANVKEFYINLTNPIYVDGKKSMSLNDVNFSAKSAANILKRHPDAYKQPNEEDEGMSFLSDYSSEYWDKDEHSKEELDRMIDKVAVEYFSDTSWVNLESAFGRDHGAAFLEAVSKETGHDGVIVDFGEDGKHYIAWFPNQMKLTSNLTPKDDASF
jgi:hypothetical protein